MMQDGAQPKKDDRQSVACLLQCYCDKSVTTMKPSGVHFSPLHATLLNFSEESRRHIISNGESIVTYLLVQQAHEKDDEDNYDGHVRQFTGQNRHVRLQTVHGAISLVMVSNQDVGVKGFAVMQMEGSPCLEMYVTQ